MTRRIARIIGKARVYVKTPFIIAPLATGVKGLPILMKKFHYHRFGPLKTHYLTWSDAHSVNGIPWYFQLFRHVELHVGRLGVFWA